MLRGGRAGELFATGDPAALAAAAGRLLDDPPLRARLSAAACEAVRAYDWPVVARDVVKVYEAVMPASGKVGGGAMSGALTVLIDVILIAVRRSWSGVYVSWRAGRLDRLHARVEAARARSTRRWCGAARSRWNSPPAACSTRRPACCWPGPRTTRGPPVSRTSWPRAT